MDGETNVPEKVMRLKPSLRQYAELDVSGYTLPGSREVKPYSDGGRVWIDPYMDSAAERAIADMWERLGEDDEDADAWSALCDLLDEYVWGFGGLTDKWGAPLPQPGTEGCWDAVPAGFMAHLVQTLAGREPEKKG